jgi:hypothetical protein
MKPEQRGADLLRIGGEALLGIPTHVELADLLRCVAGDPDVDRALTHESPRPVVNLKPRRFISAARIAEVFCSWKDSSGLACRCS